MKASDPIVIAMDAAYGIVDGIDGWMSETGDFPDNFWKKDVLDRYDRAGAAINKSAGKVMDPKDYKKLKKEVQSLVEDLIDGLEGVVSEQGEIPDRYWKRSAMRNAQKALRGVKRASRVSSLQPLRSRRDYGEDDMKEARELLTIAKELIAARGKYVKVKELPDGIRKALRSMKFRRRDIEIIPSNTYFASAGFEGNRAMSVTVNIKSGRITDEEIGSWGGSNMFEDNPIDRSGSQPVPNGSVVIAGSSGGRGTFLSIYVRPNDIDDLMLEDDDDEVDLTPKEAEALLIMGYKSGSRADQFWKSGLGEYEKTNPYITSLVKKGLVKIMGTGMRITTKGQNFRR